MNGMPLLSHPPPEARSDETACRKCNKEFNFLFNRQKRCNHCGYGYCSSCADYQALMPRNGTDRGYDALPVCFYCMEMLTITASSKSRLRSLPLSTLRAYMKAYDIRTTGAVLEKDDLVEAILRAKSANGCLYPAHEDYYRRNSIPRKSNEGRPRSFFSRTTRQEAPPQPQPQPQQRQYAPPPPPPRPYNTHQQTPPPQPQPQRQYGSPPPPPRPYGHGASPRYQQQYQQQYRSEAPSPQAPFSQPRPFRQNPPPEPQPSRPYLAREQSSSNNFRPSVSQTNFHARPGGYPGDSQSHARHPVPPRPRSAAPTVPSPRPPAPPPPVPSLDSLLQMNSHDIAHLPISTLKATLFENRVNTSVGVLEKQDLVRKVIALVADERRDREIKEREEREEEERMEWARREREEEEERKAAERRGKLMEGRLREGGGVSSDEEVTPESNTNSASSASSNPYPDKEHDGLCVVCQDEHANMAIIDCGHLALCKGCSETVMKTSRECPLCRTRIVTEQRLLRIFKS